MKNINLKSALISAILVAMVMTIIPAVNATTFSRQNPNSYYGEGCGAGGAADLVGGVYTNVVLHGGRWLGNAQNFGGPLYYQWYFNGVPETAGSIYATSKDYYPSGSYSSIGALAWSNFLDSRFVPTHTWSQSSGYAGLP